jgi:hypothetical protein
MEADGLLERERVRVAGDRLRRQIGKVEEQMRGGGAP